MTYRLQEKSIELTLGWKTLPAEYETRQEAVAMAVALALNGSNRGIGPRATAPRDFRVIDAEGEQVTVCPAHPAAAERWRRSHS